VPSANVFEAVRITRFKQLLAVQNNVYVKAEIVKSPDDIS